MQNKNLLVATLLSVILLAIFTGFNTYHSWSNQQQATAVKKSMANLSGDLKTRFSLLERSYMQKNFQLQDSLESLREQNRQLIKKLNSLETALACETEKQQVISRQLTKLSRQKTIKSPVRNLQKKINLLNKSIAAAEKLMQIQNRIRELELIQHFAPTNQEIFKLLTNECLVALNSNNWSLLDPALNNLTLFLQKNPEFTDLRKYQYNQDLKSLLERKGLKFKYKFSNKTEYFSYLLHLFQTDGNQVHQGHYADIMAGLYTNPAIRMKYENELKKIPCPGNGRPLYEYLEKLKANGDTEPIPPDIEL